MAAKSDAAPRSGAAPRAQPTMADVAARAGVSAMTVSRALRENGSVSVGTRRDILAVADELGYVLDRRAGTLSSKRSGFVSALVPSLNNSNFADTARGISQVIEDGGLQLLLGYTDYVVGKEERLIETMLMRRPEGIVLTGGRHTERARRLLRAAAVPVIETWDIPAEPVEHVVGFSNAEATRALVHALHAQGYRSIGFIGGTSNRDTRGADRRRGYGRAIEELGLPRGRVISFGQPPISTDQGGEAIVQLLDQWPDVDAAVCVSDLSAFGALMECHRRGWAVPGRIAVAGFGDFEVARAAFPRLSTVAVDAGAIGRATGDLLRRAIEASREGRVIPAELTVVPFEVIRREST